MQFQFPALDLIKYRLSDDFLHCSKVLCSLIPTGISQDHYDCCIFLFNVMYGDHCAKEEQESKKNLEGFKWKYGGTVC